MASENIIINSRAIDYSRLVGREIKLKTEQFAGQLLGTKILAVTDNNMVLDRSGSGGKIDQLVGNQAVEVMFDYKGEPVSFISRLVVPRVGRLCVPIAEEVSPRVRRQFVRVDLERDVRLTFFDDTSIEYVRLNRLKWVETSTVNIGGGGMLIKMPLYPGVDDFTVFHLGMTEIPLPKLLVGRIRHRRSGDDNHAYVGIEFIVRENCAEKLPRTLLRNLPLEMLVFDEQKQMDLARFLARQGERKLESEGAI